MIRETIGSNSRQRTDPQAWFTAIASSMTDSVSGECFNDSEFLSSSSINMTGKTLNGFTITLTCADGQSFSDNVNKNTNRLAYNVSAGVGLRTTNSYTNVIIGNQSGVTLKGLQFACDSTHNSQTEAPIYFSGGNDLLIKKCLSRSVNAPILKLDGNASMVIDSLLYKTGGSGDGFQGNGGATLIGCIVARTTLSAAAGKALNSPYAATTVKNTAFFGFANNVTGTYTGSSNIATDQTSAANFPGTSNQYSVTYTSATPFINASNTNTDFRLIDSSPLVGNGVYDGTNSPTDIVGKTRPNPPNIGAWEFAGVDVSISATNIPAIYSIPNNFKAFSFNPLRVDQTVIL